ncbi:MAG TPA: PilX N-terminal domain-containing pilus assembly protein [Gammaproteobacteria bacterium]
MSMRATLGSHPAKSSQQGAALVVGLVLLLVMTVLGVSGMNTATLELVMAGNAEAQQDAFQAAETGIDAAIAERNWNTLGPVTVTRTITTDISAQATTTNTACTVYPDTAFSAGVTGGVGAYHFDAISVGEGPRGAQSTHTQSFYVAGPAC